MSTRWPQMQDGGDEMRMEVEEENILRRAGHGNGGGAQRDAGERGTNKKRHVGEIRMTGPGSAPCWLVRHAGEERVGDLGGESPGGVAGLGVSDESDSRHEMDGVGEESEGGAPGEDWGWEPPKVEHGMSARLDVMRRVRLLEEGSCGGVGARLAGRRSAPNLLTSTRGGGEENPDVWCRLVAREWGEKDRPDIFAAMPPIEGEYDVVPQGGFRGERVERVAVAASPVDVRRHKEDPLEQTTQRGGSSLRRSLGPIGISGASSTTTTSCPWGGRKTRMTWWTASSGTSS